jgi:hypothetical protein
MMIQRRMIRMANSGGEKGDATGKGVELYVNQWNLGGFRYCLFSHVFTIPNDWYVLGMAWDGFKTF